LKTQTQKIKQIYTAKLPWVAVSEHCKCFMPSKDGGVKQSMKSHLFGGLNLSFQAVGLRDTPHLLPALSQLSDQSPPT